MTGRPGAWAREPALALAKGTVSGQVTRPFWRLVPLLSTSDPQSLPFSADVLCQELHIPRPTMDHEGGLGQGWAWDPEVYCGLSFVKSPSTGQGDMRKGYTREGRRQQKQLEKGDRRL